MRSFEGKEELDFGDVVDMCCDEVLDLPTVCLLEDTETPNIEWLGDMR